MNNILIKMAGSWWRDPAVQEEMTGVGDPATRMWKAACGTLMTPTTEEAWTKIKATSRPDTLWHSLTNCISHQAGVWQTLLCKGMDDVIQPAAFKMAIVLRHTPPELTVQLLAELLRLHPQSQDLTSYVLSLLTDDEPGCGECVFGAGGNSPNSLYSLNLPNSPAPLRDLQLFGDLELSIMASPVEVYDAHSALLRAEYSQLTQTDYIELRIRVLNQFTQIPQLFHTPEFGHLELSARDNIQREITELRGTLLTHRK